MKRLLRNKRGSNLIYVVVLVSLLGVLAAAYSVAVLYNARSAAAQRAYQQDRSGAKSLLISVVNSVEAMDNDVVDELVEEAEDDLLDYFDVLAAEDGIPDGLGGIPKYSNYVEESYTSTGKSVLSDGNVTVTLSYFPMEEGNGELMVSVKADLNGRSFDLGATLEAQYGQSEELYGIRPIEGWSVLSYYEK